MSFPDGATLHKLSINSFDQTVRAVIQRHGGGHCGCLFISQTHLKQQRSAKMINKLSVKKIICLLSPFARLHNARPLGRKISF